MARRRVNMLDESPEVQEKIIENIKNDNQENEDKQGETLSNNKDNSSKKKNKSNKKEPGDLTFTSTPEIFKIGDKVKIKPDVSNDMLGRRIHNGVKNYQYKIHNIRDDGYCTVICLTHCFTLKLTQLEKIV